MKKLLLLSLMPLMIFAKSSYIDLGVHGELFDIAERNGNDVIQEEIKNVNFEEMRRNLIYKVDSLYTSKMGMPSSTKTSIKEVRDLVAARWDVVDSYGNVLYRKGDLIPNALPNGVSLNICFIDGKDSYKVLEYIVEKFGKCIYMIDNYDSRIFSKKFNKSQVFPLNPQNEIYVNRFNIKSLPTKITKVKDLIITETIDVISLRKQLLLENK